MKAVNRTVQKKYRAAIPEEMWREVGLDRGDDILITIRNGRIVIEPNY